MSASGSHNASVFADRLYKVSLFSLIVLLTVVLLGTGYDIGQQVVKNARGPLRFSDTAIVGGGYFLVVALSIFISFARLWTVRKELASIPKGYLPLGKDELNKNVYRLTAAEYTRCAMIAYQSCPRGRTLPGWGTPGSVYDGLHFRTEILDSVGVLTEAVWTQLFPHSIPPKPLNSRNRSPLADYWPLLEPETIIAADGDSAPTLVQPVLPATLAPILRLYEQHLENARTGYQSKTMVEWTAADEGELRTAVKAKRLLKNAIASSGHTSQSDTKALDLADTKITELSNRKRWFDAQQAQASQQFRPAEDETPSKALNVQGHGEISERKQGKMPVQNRAQRAQPVIQEGSSRVPQTSSRHRDVTPPYEYSGEEWQGTVDAMRASLEVEQPPAPRSASKDSAPHATAARRNSGASGKQASHFVRPSKQWASLINGPATDDVVHVRRPGGDTVDLPRLSEQQAAEDRRQRLEQRARQRMKAPDPNIPLAVPAQQQPQHTSTSSQVTTAQPRRIDPKPRRESETAASRPQRPTVNTNITSTTTTTRRWEFASAQQNAPMQVYYPGRQPTTAQTAKTDERLVLLQRLKAEEAAAKREADRLLRNNTSGAGAPIDALIDNRRTSTVDYPSANNNHTVIMRTAHQPMTRASTSNARASTGYIQNHVRVSGAIDGQRRERSPQHPTESVRPSDSSASLRSSIGIIPTSVRPPKRRHFPNATEALYVHDADLKRIDFELAQEQDYRLRHQELMPGFKARSVERQRLVAQIILERQHWRLTDVALYLDPADFGVDSTALLASHRSQRTESASTLSTRTRPPARLPTSHTHRNPAAASDSIDHGQPLQLRSYSTREQMLKQHDKDNKNLTKEVEDELAYLERHGRHMENQPQRRANRQKLIERIERERKHLVDLSPFRFAHTPGTEVYTNTPHGRKPIQFPDGTPVPLPRMSGLDLNPPSAASGHRGRLQKRNKNGPHRESWWRRWTGLSATNVEASRSNKQQYDGDPNKNKMTREVKRQIKQGSAKLNRRARRS
ncbi:hypothetical protein EMMF5_005491 [Cystobasidiomycetes sp. EMM_F5]